MLIILNLSFWRFNMVVWEAKLDEVYDCKVTRIDEYKGRLTVTDLFDKVLLDEEVTLTYGASFGPDISDVALWEDKSVEVIDKLIEG
jgi:hypothetical protein